MSPSSQVVHDPYLGAVEVRVLTAADADEIAAEADRLLPGRYAELLAAGPPHGMAPSELRESLRGGMIAAGAVERGVLDQTVLDQLGLPDGNPADPDPDAVAEAIARLGRAILDLSERAA